MGNNAPVLEVRDLLKTFGAVVAANEINVDISRGEDVGIICEGPEIAVDLGQTLRADIQDDPIEAEIVSIEAQMQAEIMAIKAKYEPRLAELRAIKAREAKDA